MRVPLRPQIKAAYSQFYYSNKSRRNGYNSAPGQYINSSINSCQETRKTQTFLKSLRAALSIFDDEIATLTDVRETAYETFVTSSKIQKTPETKETFQEPDDPNPASDTLSSSSSESLYNPFA